MEPLTFLTIMAGTAWVTKMYTIQMTKVKS